MEGINKDFEATLETLKKQKELFSKMSETMQAQADDLRAKFNNFQPKKVVEVKIVKGRKMTLYDNKEILIEFETQEFANRYFKMAKE